MRNDGIPHPNVPELADDCLRAIEEIASEGAAEMAAKMGPGGDEGQITEEMVAASFLKMIKGLIAMMLLNREFLDVEDNEQAKRYLGKAHWELINDQLAKRGAPLRLCLVTQ